MSGTRKTFKSCRIQSSQSQAQSQNSEKGNQGARRIMGSDSHGGGKGNLKKVFRIQFVYNPIIQARI